MSSLDKDTVMSYLLDLRGIEPGTNYATVYNALLAMLDVADDAYNAGRAYQREVDAELIVFMYGDGKDMAKAIREQKIDD